MQRVEEKQSEGDETQSTMGERRKSEEVEMSPRIKEQIDEELNKPFEELDETREEKQESIGVQEEQNVQNDATWKVNVMKQEEELLKEKEKLFFKKTKQSKQQQK